MLNGRRDATYGADGKRASAAGLVEAAMAYGNAHKVDPGHIVLNYAKHNNAWPMAIAALNMMQKNLKPAGMVVNDLAWRCLREEALPKDTAALLHRVMPY